MYKGWAWQPIQDDIEMANIDLPKVLTAHLEEVMDVYGGMSVYDLEKLTHAEYPWQKARSNVPADEPSNAIISQADMKEFYGRLVNGEN